MGFLLKSAYKAEELEAYIESAHQQITKYLRNPPDPIKYQCAQYLVFSENAEDVNVGATFLYELASKRNNRYAEYMFYLAIGYVRLGHRKEGQQCCEAILQVTTTGEKEFRQKALMLREFLRTFEGIPIPPDLLVREARHQSQYRAQNRSRSRIRNTTRDTVLRATVRDQDEVYGESSINMTSNPDPTTIGAEIGAGMVAVLRAFFEQARN